jgi:hypothetical protein
MIDAIAIRSGGFGLKDCSYPCRPARQGIGWPFLSEFFGHPKKFTEKKMQYKENFNLQIRF